MHFHPYHLVEMSPWPLTSSLSAFIIIRILLCLFKNDIDFLIRCFTFFRFLSSYLWWRDIRRESTFQGNHNFIVTKGLKLGILLFILSEIIFFYSFFWRFFHSSLVPEIEIGIIWPPTGINMFNPFNIPLLNTSILLRSGVTVTWVHHSIINKKYNKRKIRLLITIVLGLYFTILQGFEYQTSEFSFNDRIFGSVFFLATGFHGLHVIIGRVFLSVRFFRFRRGHFSCNHHINFEIAAWYWHFVDVVWLFLYIFIYWWIYYFISIINNYI